MAYIDPDGMFYGDRMALISDEAKLAWPYFWVASNSVGRLELNYKKVIARAFSQFKKPPTEKKFWKWVAEYSKAWLLFTYLDGSQSWGQWDVSERYLPKHKLASDKRTPAPAHAEYVEWRKGYLGWKLSNIAKHNHANNSARSAKPVVEVEVEVEVEVDKTLPAKTAGKGAIPAPDSKEPGTLFEMGKLKAADVPSAEQLAEVYAPKIHERHPRFRRDIGLKEVKQKLVTILTQLPRAERPGKMQQIDHNHEGFCNSEQWQKDDGEFAKSLEKWLAPTKGRWDTEPPARASPRKQEYISATEEMT